MDVFEFNKTLRTRLEEATVALNCDNSPVSASEVISRWASFIECYVESSGWQALWNIPHLICEELDIMYPTTVLGVVEEVLYDELKANFTVLAVDEVIELPRTHEVHLIDLWPIKNQENEHLDVERTADCIDKLRFFFNHIWMPWDNDCDNDINWAEKHLQSRIRFYFDLKRNDMNRCLAAHIRTLIIEAKYIQSKREYLEMDLSDNETSPEDESDLNESNVSDLMRSHLRLTMIKSQLEMLENGLMRKIYENIMFYNNKYLKHALILQNKEQRRSLECEKNTERVFIVTKQCGLEEQLTYLERARDVISTGSPVQMCRSLMSVLDFCNPSDKIFLPSGVHIMKFLEYFNDNGLIQGLSNGIQYNEKENFVRTPQDSDVFLTTQDSTSSLFIFDGDFTLRNLVLDCRTVRCGSTIKGGHVTLENCLIIGDSKSSTKQGLIVCGEGKLTVCNSLVKGFAEGIVIRDEGKVSMVNSTIYGCRHGLHVEDGTEIQFENAAIVDCSMCGIYYSTNCLLNNVEKPRVVYDELYTMREDICERLPWSGTCTFEDIQQNIVLSNIQASLVSERIANLLSEAKEDVSSLSFQLNSAQNGNESDDDHSNTSSDVISVGDEEESVILID